MVYQYYCFPPLTKLVIEKLGTLNFQIDKHNKPSIQILRTIKKCINEIIQTNEAKPNETNEETK